MRPSAATALALALCALCGCHTAEQSVAAPQAVALQPQAQAQPRSARHTFGRGVNVNHWLASNYDDIHAYGSAWFDEEDVAWIAAQGFDHIRFRVSGRQWVGGDGELDEGKLAPFEAALRWTRQHGLGVVLTITTIPGVEINREGETQGLERPATIAAATDFWGRVARRFAAVDDQLRFEIYHRPSAENPASLRGFSEATQHTIAEVSPARFVYLQPDDGEMGKISGALPDGPVGLSVMFDDASALPTLDRWAAAEGKGREVYVGEFGVSIDEKDDVARAYIRETLGAIQQRHMSWAVYDYESGCAIRGADGAPTRVLDALGMRPRR